MFVELAHIKKSLKILEHLNNLQADIVLLEEAYISKKGQNTLNSPKFHHAYLASYNSK